MEETKRRGGRPRVREESTRLGSYVGFKSEPDLNEKLEASAAIKERSLSAETRERVAASFVREGHLIEALVLDCGAAPAAMLMIAAKAMARAGRSAAYSATGSAATAENWSDAAASFDEAAAAVYEVLRAFSPEGEPPEVLTFNTKGSSGRSIAREFLAAIKTPSDGAIEFWAKPLRELLGEEIVERMRVGPLGMVITADTSVRFVTPEHERRLKEDPPLPVTKRAVRRRGGRSEA